MNKKEQFRRDKQITREIHRLFWQANFVDKTGLIVCYLTRVPAVAAYNIFIPLACAFGIEAIINRQYDRVAAYAWGIIILAIVYCVLWSIGGLAISRNALRGSQYLQQAAFKNILNKDYEFYSNTYSGSLGSHIIRLKDTFNNYGQLVTLSIPKQVTIVISAVAVIAYQSWQLALVTLAAMLIVLSFTIFSSSWRLKFRRRLSEANSELAGLTGDALSHGTVVKSFANETYEGTRLKDYLDIKWGKAQYQSWISTLPADNGRMILAAIATAVLLILSAKFYREGDITITIVALIQLYVVKLIAATLDIADIVKTYEDVMGSAYHPVKTLLQESEVVDQADAKVLTLSKRMHISFDKVSFAYNADRPEVKAIDSFTLSIAPGEKIGLVGYSGSGKTTLTKLIMRFMDTTSGNININGTDIRGYSQSSLRRAVAYVPQEPLLFHRSISENIRYGSPHATQADTERVSKMSYIDEFIGSLPESYDTLVGERGIKLSGGQRQRVAIARALLKDAPILLLDEATSALDSRSEQYIQKALWKLMKGRTAIVIAHRLSTIQRMDRIVVMDKGRIVQTGTHDELLKQPGIYAELWAHQSGGYIGLPTVE